MQPAIATVPVPSDPVARKRRARGAARLKALGIDVGSLETEAVREIYEQWRAAYINVATAGLHMNPIHAEGDPLSGACLHARHGMLVDAIAHFYGAHPAGWSPARIAWPHVGAEQVPTITVTTHTPAALRALAAGS